MSLAAGTRLGPYEVLGLIGAGGMGEVYKAKDLRLDRTVAIKVLPPHFCDPEHRARFEREARTIATLSHPHICTLYDVGQLTSSLFLVMEHLDGESLAERLRKGPLPVTQALEIGAQIAEALAAAHRAGIVHRDLKPGNIMLTKSGVKLLDFGLAKVPALAADSALVCDVTHLEPLTRKGTVYGTVPYIAPEQLQGQEADVRSDIWALGLVLYESVTGTRAFTGDTEASLIGAILERQPRPLAAIQPLAPVALDRLVARCLAKDPNERWDSAHDVADALRWIAESGPVNLERVSAAPSRVRWRPIALVMLSVALVVTGAAWWIRAGGRLTPTAARSAISSIAVLPLENLSRDDAQEFFADGLTDALITELAHIPSLRVISRTSIMQYKKTRKTVGEISRELNGVGAILEGTVMRDRDRVAITVQLIDASRDQHLWSETYERDLSDILAVRREIAWTVAHEIRVATDPEQQPARDLPKVNPAAFEQYLRAITLQEAGDSEQTARASLAAAEEAVRTDAGFAPAQAALAEANAKLWWYHWDRSRIRAQQARVAADRAVELDPQLGEAHRAKGYVYYWIDLDYSRALAELGVALGKNPNDSKSVLGVASVQRRQGRMEEARRSFERATTLNPLDASLFFNLGETYALLRRPEDADRSFDRAIAISSYPRPFAYKLRWRLRVRPELTQAREIERRAESAGVAEDPLVLYHRVLLHTYAGDARTSLQLLAASAHDAFEEQFWYVPRGFLEGQAYDAMGERVKARASYTEAKRLALAKLAQDGDDSRCHSALGIALAALGDIPGAVREGKAGVDGMPVTREAYRGIYRLEDLARIYALTGQRDAAVEVLRRVLSIPDDLSAAGVLIDPSFRSLHGHAGFEQLVANARR